MISKTKLRIGAGVFIFLLLFTAIVRISLAAADSDDGGADTDTDGALGDDSPGDDSAEEGTAMLQSGIPIGIGIAAVATAFILYMLKKKHKI